MKKIMAGREKGKRRWTFNESLPKIESVKKLSDARGQGKESLRRITVLNKLFMKYITDLMATDGFAKEVTGYGIQVRIIQNCAMISLIRFLSFQVTVVKVSPDFQSLNVFWLAKNDENDEKVEQILKSVAGPIRHELSQLRLMGEVPRIYFVKDKHYSKAAEVDVLLQRADFGEDFNPTDPTLFMKSSLELQMKLPDDVRSKIYEMEQSSVEEEEYVEEELPEMRNDVMGIDHSVIMKKIAVNIDKSKKAWETFGTRSETILADVTPTRDFAAVQLEVDKLNKDEEVRNEFAKFLERKQFTKRTPERKKHKNLAPEEDDEESQEFRDPLPDNDFIDDDLDTKK